MPRTKGTKRRANGTGRVYKSNGVYYLQYRLPNGSRKSVTLKDEKGEKITDLRKAETAARKYLEPFRKINEIDNRLEYLEEKAKLKQFAARTTILLEEAFERFLTKPRRKTMTEITLKINRTHWEDFILFVQDKYHLTHLAEVETEHADAYIAFLRDHGVYKRTIGKAGKKYKKNNVSVATINKYLKICRYVFKMLLPDLGFGVTENPFYHIRCIELKQIDREVFTPDPPFGNNLFYADLADFFYVWLRIPMQKWYEGQPEAEYFRPERTPHSSEAVDNSVEHPDDREDYEKVIYIDKPNLKILRELCGDDSLEINDLNPLFRPEPSSEFYSQTLAACWSEAGRHLKPGGIMAFTFHHNDDNAWIDVLKALFEAGYYLIATYPIRSDETKGDNAAFGSKKIEYDVIHVCRKRLSDPEPVSYAKMRKFVREEAGRLKALLETVHGKELPEADLRVILRGKSLEFYSQHYGQVQTGTGEMLGVRDALLGINQMLDDILEDAAAGGGLRPPESAEPISRLYLRVFKNIQQTTRDNLHKTLQGSGISQNDLESRGWIKVHGREVDVVSIAERYAMLTKRGLTRKHIKTDLNQTFFLMGMVLARKNLINELETGNLKLKKSVQDILKWFHQTSEDPITRQAASSVITLMAQFEQDQKAKATVQEQPSLFDFMDEEM